MSTARRRFLCAFLSLFAFVATACAVNPNAPTSVTGTWVGPVTSSILGTGQYQLTISQSGSTITGAFAATFPGVTSSATGALTGTVQGSAFNASLPFGTCIRIWTGTVSGTTMSGTIAATGVCGTPDSGTFTLTLE
jgi:hypothetical protein